ncbi:MAG TPA: hypothetical protein VFE31_08245 [Opitutaceae bacterium]|nr:hypothetical protein [Opitutaceae bacterium]
MTGLERQEQPKQIIRVQVGKGVRLKGQDEQTASGSQGRGRAVEIDHSAGAKIADEHAAMMRTKFKGRRLQFTARGSFEQDDIIGQAQLGMAATMEVIPGRAQGTELRGKIGSGHGHPEMTEKRPQLASIWLFYAL